jgi:zinc transport system permease protein
VKPMVDTIMLYFSYPFIRYAFVVGILVSLSASLLGVVLVLRRFSLMGEGLSHVAFGALAIAMPLQLTNNMVVILPLTILCAVMLLYRGEKVKLQGDAMIALISVSSLGLGYLLIHLFSRSANLSGDVCTVLFGSTSILTMTPEKIRWSVILSIGVVMIFVLIYHRIFAITFDEEFATGTGIPTGAYHLLMAIIIAVIIVLGMDLVGSLLITALIILPALSAMSLWKSFFKVTVFAAVFAVLGTGSGLLLSIVAGTPVGPTIVAVDMVIFALCSLVGKIGGSWR